MSSSEKWSQVLVEFGLTGVQARVYLASAQLQLASVAEISTLSKVRKEDVYRSLPRLESLGLVEKTFNSPVKIRATPVDQALSNLLRQEHEQTTGRLKTLETKSKEIIQNFREAPETPKNRENGAEFALLSKRESVLGKVAGIIRNAELELDALYGRDSIVQCLYLCAEELKQAAHRGVRLRIITNLQGYSESNQRIIEEQLSPEASVEIRYADMPLSHFLISDFTQALLSTNAGGKLGENSCLWTNNASLVEVLRSNFESLWRSAVRPEDITENSLSSRILNYTQKLKPTNHAMLVYDSTNAKHQALFTYLNAGLTDNEAAVYVTHEETPTDIRAAMKKFGINTEKYEKTGALQILSYDEVYMRGEKFDAEKAINFWKKQYYQTLERKFSGLRVTGETSRFFDHKLIADFVNYEKAMQKELSIPMIAICAFNRKDLEKNQESMRVYTELIQAHGTALLTALDQKLGMIEIRT